MERNDAFDIFKGLAIIAVIAIHASSSGWSWFDSGTLEFNFYFTLVVKQVYAFAVPSFFFMAGYFLVKKGVAANVDYKFFIGKKLKRILIPYVLWSLIIMILLHQNTNVADVIYRLLLGKAQGTYYFIIALSLLACISPLLINATNIRNTTLIILFINLLTLGGIYYMRFSTEGNFEWWKAALPFSTWIFFYYLGVVASRLDLKTLFPWCTNFRAVILTVLVTFILSQLEAFSLLILYGKGYGGESTIKISSFLYSLSIISLFLFIKDRDSSSFQWLAPIGKASFGIYLIHELFRGKISRVLAEYDIIYSIQPVFQMVVVISTLAICMSLIIIVRKLIGENNSSKYLGF